MSVRIDSSDIELILAGQTVSYNESYDVKMGCFDLPCTFSLTFGWSQSAGRLIENVTPYIPFELRVGGRPGFKGRVGHISVERQRGTTVTVAGRDTLADLLRYKVDKNVTFSKSTYVGLLEEVLGRIGVTNPTIVGDYQELATKRSGMSPNVFKAVLDPTTDVIVFKESISEINAQVKAKTGVTWLAFLQEYFNRAGLFLWSGPNGEYVLTRPNPNQEPSYRLFIGRAPSEKNAVNAKLIEYTRDIEDRHTHIQVNARGGGTKAGRAYYLGETIDDEMQSFGLNNFRAVRDKTVTTPKQAEDLARRIRAEERRKGFKLIYEVAGHRGLTPRGGQNVYTFDRTCEVVDEELDIDETFYVSEVHYRRTVGEGTKTLLTLLPLRYLEF